MTQSDMREIWSLLAGLRPMNRDYLQSDEIMRAWALALQPYPITAVKKALLETCREVNYWPLVSEVVSRIPPSVSPEVPREETADPWATPARKARIKADLARLKQDQAGRARA